MSPTRPKVAFFDFTCCEGCQLTALDSLQDHPELLEAIDIVQFREAMSEKGEDYQIAFVEGACTRPNDEARLHKIRDTADLVVSLGACAHLGGVNSLRNWQSLDEVKRYVYGAMGKIRESYTVRPVDAVIPVDAFVPGCPVDRVEFIMVVKALLQNRQPQIPDYPVCVECKLRENVCLLLQGKPCLGPVVRAGCGALCPSLGVGCEGCRGLISNPNVAWLKAAMQKHEISETDIDARMRLFLSYQLKEGEVSGHGSRH
jgi:sulfhydrogenase subunit delta